MQTSQEQREAGRVWDARTVRVLLAVTATTIGFWALLSAHDPRITMFGIVLWGYVSTIIAALK